jgi:hypothetical protein
MGVPKTKLWGYQRLNYGVLKTKLWGYQKLNMGVPKTKNFLITMIQEVLRLLNENPKKSGDEDEEEADGEGEAASRRTTRQQAVNKDEVCIFTGIMPV